MGKVNSREYRVWDTAEEAALKAGVRKHGLGAWERIRTDPDFDVLLHRTGVQLKDKWRNLVKFRHITPDETLELQPKTSGPWHRKYTATAAAAQRLAAAAPQQQPAGSSRAGAAAAAAAGSSSKNEDSSQHEQLQDQQQDDGDEQQQQPKRKSSRAVKRRTFDDVEAEQDDDDSWEIGCESESRGIGAKKRRRYGPDGQAGPAEDRRFGIYDRRRYGSASARDRSRQHRLSGTDTTAAAGAATAGPQRHHQDHRPGSGSSSDATEFEDSYVVDCVCGAIVDDGNLMIECEHCKAWSHTACLQAQMELNPHIHRYDFMHFVCIKCQQQQPQHPAGHKKHRHKAQAHPPVTAAAVEPEEAAAVAAAAARAAATAAAAAAAASAVPQQIPGLPSLLELLGDPHSYPANAAAAAHDQQQQFVTSGLSGLPAALLGQGDQGRLTPNLGRSTPNNIHTSHPLLQHSWLLQEAAAAAGLFGTADNADQPDLAAAAAAHHISGSDAAGTRAAAVDGLQHGTLSSLHGAAAGSSGALAAAAELASMAAAGGSSNSRHIAAGNASNFAAAAAAASASNVLHVNGGMHSADAADMWNAAAAAAADSWSSQHRGPNSHAAAAAAGNPDSSSAGMVEIDPVLLLYLQGSLQVHKRQRGTSFSRKHKEGGRDWGRAFVDWEALQKQESETDLAGTAAAAAAAAASDGGDDAAAADRVCHGRHHPAAVVPGHPKYAAYQQQAERDHGDGAQAGVQQQQQRRRQRQQPRRQRYRSGGNEGSGQPAAAAAVVSHVPSAVGPVVRRTVARKLNGRAIMSGTPADNGDIQQQQQQQRLQVTGAGNNNSSSSRLGCTKMGRALEQHQKELEELLGSGADASPALAAGSSSPGLAAAAVKAEQGEVINPAQTSATLSNKLQMQHGAVYDAQQQQHPSLVLRRAAAAAAAAAAGRSTPALSAADADAAMRLPASSPHPLVHSHGGLSGDDPLRPDSLTGTGLIGPMGVIYPALFGGAQTTAGTPPLPPLDRPPSRPPSSGIAAALAAAAMAAAAASAASTPTTRPPSRSSSRQAAAADGMMTTSSALDPILAAAALQLHDARPPTPLGLADYAALFRAATPDALGSSHLAAALNDLHGAGSWLLSRTPPLSDVLQGIGAAASSNTAAAAGVGGGGDTPMSAAAAVGSSLGRPLSSDPTALFAAAAAAVAMGMANGAAAAAAASSGAAADPSSYLNIDELILQPQRDAAVASAVEPEVSTGPAVPTSTALLVPVTTETAAVQALSTAPSHSVGCGLDLLAGAVAAEAEQQQQQPS